MTCPAAERLHQQLLQLGWESKLTYARGPVEFTELGQPRGDGTRPRVLVTRELDSALVRACHPRRQSDDMAWALVALYIQHGVTAKGTPSWSYDLGYRAGDYVPKPLRVTDLRDYLDYFAYGPILGPMQKEAA